MKNPKFRENAKFLLGVILIPPVLLVFAVLLIVGEGNYRFNQWRQGKQVKHDPQGSHVRRM
jgi:hypothetical protein